VLSPASIAAAQDIIKIVVTGDSVNLRSEPSTKGKVYCQVNFNTAFLADPVPIRDRSDNSEWYKILFTFSELDNRIIQTHKLSVYNFSYPYISARFAKKEPLNEFDENQLDYLRRGKPLNIHVGDDLSVYDLSIESETLKAPLTLRKEPKADSDSIVVPAGTIVLICIGELGVYADMDENYWLYIMDKDQKLIGWRRADGTQ